MVDYPTPHKSGKADYQSTFRLYGAMKVRSLFLQIKYRCYDSSKLVYIKVEVLLVSAEIAVVKWNKEQPIK